MWKAFWVASIGRVENLLPLLEGSAHEMEEIVR
jgi:hypothetical protein